jgi:bacteriocin-like protein
MKNPKKESGKKIKELSDEELMEITGGYSLRKYPFYPGPVLAYGIVAFYGVGLKW